MFDLDVDDAVDLVGRLLDNLLLTGGSSGREGSDLRRVVGEARATVEASIRSATLGSVLQDCFTRARLAGAGLAAMSRVRSAMVAEQVTSDLSATIVNAGALLCLAQESLILADIEFRSREDVEAALAQMNTGFGAAEESVADRKDVGIYRSLLALHASVTRHLVDRSRPLPRIVHFQYSKPMPALALSNRIYGAGDRSDELLAENKTIHPLFMTGRGRALSA